MAVWCGPADVVPRHPPVWWSGFQAIALVRVHGCGLVRYPVDVRESGGGRRVVDWPGMFWWDWRGRRWVWLVAIWLAVVGLGGSRVPGGPGAGRPAPRGRTRMVRSRVGLLGWCGIDSDRTVSARMADHDAAQELA